MDELSFLGKKMLIFITCKSPIFLPSSHASLPASQRKWCGIDFIPHDPLARALPLARNPLIERMVFTPLTLNI